jgi:hypothetical protein
VLPLVCLHRKDRLVLVDVRNIRIANIDDAFLPDQALAQPVSVDDTLAM